MDTASTVNPSILENRPRSRPIFRVAGIGALAATAANVALWAGGRASDVGFGVSPAAGDPFQVGAVLVIVTTLLVFAAGSAVLSLAARRSRQMVRVVIAAAAVFAVASTAGPLSTADDTASGLLLTAMHLVTGAIFVGMAARVRVS
ncbi:MAG TPA: DUF6069 family protein [Jiangellaceae bacterium]